MALAMQTQRQQRTESPERWRRALARAIDAGLEVFVVADTGERMVTSASKLDQLHRTDGRACTCEAALAGDPVCQHRAAVRYCLGWIHPEPDPEPLIPAPAAPQRVDCAMCNGCGVVYSRSGGWKCDHCHGAGQVTAYPARVAA